MDFSLFPPTQREKDARIKLKKASDGKLCAAEANTCILWALVWRGWWCMAIFMQISPHRLRDSSGGWEFNFHVWIYTKREFIMTFRPSLPGNGSRRMRAEKNSNYFRPSSTERKKSESVMFMLRFLANSGKVISCIRAGDVTASLANEASAMKNFYHSGSCLFLCPREMRNLRLFYGWKIFTDAFIHACEWSRFFIIVEEQQYTPAVVRWWKAGELGEEKD